MDYKRSHKFCPLLNEENNQLKYFFNKKFKQNIACILCNQYNECPYQKQFDFPKNNAIITIAKQSLPNKKVHSAFDLIIYDEDMLKANIIEPYFPKLDMEILEQLSYGSNIETIQSELKTLIENKSIIEGWEYINALKEEAAILRSKKALLKTRDELKEIQKEKTSEILPFYG